MIKSKILVILGPTASGKSEYAIRLAKKINGEIISADSRQVYRGLDIGTAKVRGQLCTDIVDPKNTASIIDWKKCAEDAITSILKNQKIPIIVGGSAFYIRAVADGIVIPEVPPNNKLRKTLEKKSLSILLGMLKKKDPKRYKTVDQKNKRRVMRSLEIIKALGKVPKFKAVQKYDAKFIGIKREQRDLEKRIIKRTKAMLKMGLLSEVGKLIRSGVSLKRLGELGFEYKYPALFLQKKISREEMVKKLNRETLDYTRRQILWWKKDKRIKWIKPPSRASRKSL